MRALLLWLLMLALPVYEASGTSLRMRGTTPSPALAVRGFR